MGDLFTFQEESWVKIDVVHEYDSTNLTVAGVVTQNTFSGKNPLCMHAKECDSLLLSSALMPQIS